MPSYTIKSAQRESTEREQNKPPVIWGTKASITQGKIQEQLTFLNRTISSTSARYSDISYYTWHNKSILPLYSLLCSRLSLPQGEKEIVWDNKRTNKWKEVQRESEWTGIRDWNGVFLWGDFKWQCNRCSPKGWLGLINLDYWDKSGLLLTSFKCSNCLFSFSFGNNNMVGTFWCH